MLQACGRICKCLGEHFQPYLPYVYDHFRWPHCEEEGWSFVRQNTTSDVSAFDDDSL